MVKKEGSVEVMIVENEIPRRPLYVDCFNKTFVAFPEITLVFE